MTTSAIREKLHAFIDAIEDEKAEAIYTLFEDTIDPDLQRKKLIFAEREKYLKGEGKSYNWEEVKSMAKDKTNRHVL